IGHGAPGVCALGAAGLVPPGVVFAICPGDGEATPVRCPGGGDAFAEVEPPGELAAAAVAADGLAAFAGGVTGDAAAACAGGGIDAVAPCGAGLALVGGAGDPSPCAGARAPMSARSCPIRIFPRNTGRSKM